MSALNKAGKAPEEFQNRRSASEESEVLSFMADSWVTHMFWAWDRANQGAPYDREQQSPCRPEIG